MEAAVSPNTILWLAFAVAFMFGAIAQKTHFCTMGAVADIVNMGDWSRMRMWLLAIGVAILGSAALHGAGLIDLGKSIYRTPNFTWLSYLVGGACFGVGMVLASGCGGKTLIRIGGGNLKSLVVFLVLGLVAYMTMRGVFGVFRVNVLEKAVITFPGGQDIPALLVALGMEAKTAFLLAVIVIGGGLTAFSLLKRDFWTLDNLLAGFGIGLSVVAAWYVSGHLGYLAEHPDTLEEAFIATNSGRMEALSFVAPQAYTLELLMLWSDTSRTVTFAIATALGVIAGSFAWSIVTRGFRWEGFAGIEDTANHLLGAALMGFGGVVAMGCTVGQGISGFSTLALGSIVTFLAIVAGAAATLKFQYWRMMRKA
ncbi:YeeE/YedE family protein [Ferribacterium limneticum]|uniref:YeeE/YedE family protein n=1 Tax=Ferribacterium limneticum TaxID=76259 RepID=UPI001CF9500E|nr:YeeE/YedE family protein [Ferribacterium limneticum]UCV28362.1 YeeE/YedE family protein [Ferribacterium limneticum]UCV32279.1 YeeE/YedE family protein [Ferribacterium limneticum]